MLASFETGRATDTLNNSLDDIRTCNAGALPLISAEKTPLDLTLRNLRARNIGGFALKLSKGTGVLKLLWIPRCLQPSRRASANILILIAARDA